jgi:hypothetical protein
MTDIHRNTVTFRITEEMAAQMAGFHRRGHLEPVTPSAEQVAQHTRAAELIREVENNPFVDITHDGLTLCELETERWVVDETAEEYVARWREARDTWVRPVPLGPFRESFTRAIDRAFDRTALTPKGQTP